MDVKLGGSTNTEEEREEEEGTDFVRADVPISKPVVFALSLPPMLYELYLPALHLLLLKQQQWELVLALRQQMRCPDCFNFVNI